MSIAEPKGKVLIRQTFTIQISLDPLMLDFHGRPDSEDVGLTKEAHPGSSLSESLIALG